MDLAGESGLRLTLADAPSASVTQHILATENALKTLMGGALTDAVPGYTTLTLFFDATLMTRDEVILAINTVIASSPLQTSTLSEGTMKSGQLITLPVWYAPESGADLESLAAEKNLTTQQLIALHSGTEYLAYANGFAPGFCYLGEVPTAIAAPRLSTPRREVPTGSVAIADRQTAVYPKASPGGWRLIGRCPLPLFDLHNTSPNRINVGDRVRFEPISRQTFFDLLARTS